MIKKIEKVLKIKVQTNKNKIKILSPGMMKKHYSPGIPVLINQKNMMEIVLLYILEINIKIKKIF